MRGAAVAAGLVASLVAGACATVEAPRVQPAPATTAATTRATSPPTTTPPTVLAATTAPPTTVATTTSTTAAPPPTWPLTGQPADPSSPAYRRPALAVKIDDAPQARPQSGLNAADVVVEEIVESATRYLAVFHSADVEPVGPIRSARTSDLAVVAALGAPLFAWSGGNAGVRAAVAGSGVVDVGYDTRPGAGYYRAGDRPAPHNLYASTARLRESAADEAGTAPPTPMFRYAPGGPGRGEPASVVTWTMEGNRELWEWIAELGIFARSTNGRADNDRESGTRLATTNVVFLETEYLASPADPRSPEAQSVGSGAAVVLSGGRAVDATWRRAAPTAPFELVDAAGAPVPLAPGRTWVELVRPGTAVERS